LALSAARVGRRFGEHKSKQHVALVRKVTTRGAVATARALSLTELTCE